MFEQAEPQWRAARRQARKCRDQALERLLGPGPAADPSVQPWWLVQLQQQQAGPLTLRLPAGHWRQGESAQPLLQQPAPGGGCWVQLALPAGVAAMPLLRTSAGAGNGEGVSPPVQHPVRLEALAEQRWLLSNGLVRAELGAAGVLQLWGCDGVPQLAGPLAWCRWADHGEFWDAWDLAADYRDKPLELYWDPEPRLAEQGPLCSRIVWRGRCGRSALRLDVQLRAATPWLELQLRVEWQQRHELLRLEVPLAQSACRYAADTPAGVLERPTQPLNPREQARWEVPALSWLASQTSNGGGLALLLDGPQGISAAVDRLGVSLLRAPTWPDPSADQGLQRLRLALMPCVEGWRQQAVPRQAQRWREPIWLRPASAPRAPAPADPLHAPWPALDWGSEALQMVLLQPLAGTGEARLVLQNLSPQRQRPRWSPGWVGEREAMDGSKACCSADELGPWQIGAWRLRRDAAVNQSS